MKLSISTYIDMSDMKLVFRENFSNFHILPLNVQIVNAKCFRLLTICLSPGYILMQCVCRKYGWVQMLIFQCLIYRVINWSIKFSVYQTWRTCSIYIDTKYSYKLRNLNDKLDVREGFFINVNGYNLSKNLTIGNMYRPPHVNNNNNNIEKFVEISPIIDIIQKENCYAAIVGDSNKNLLQVNERDKYAYILDLMCTKNFFSRITLPTCIARRSQRSTATKGRQHQKDIRYSD